jgi:Kdo2-lipid IVA lauroyltransferase/acyltransferase
LCLLPSRRRLAERNLAQAFPRLSPRARRRLCRRSYEHLGMMMVELSGMLTRPLDRLLARVVLDGGEGLNAVMDTHGRALIVTAHLGNWEILTAAHRIMGYPLTIVARPLDSRGLDALVGRLRLKAGIELVDKRNAVRPVLRALRAGRLVGILLDQNAARHEGVFVPFFGRLASTSKSIAVLALRTGAPIVPVFTWRESGGRHRVSIGAPIDLPSGLGHGEAIVELTRRCTQAIEDAITARPEQWLWMHARWRTRPPEDEGNAGPAAGAPT